MYLVLQASIYLQLRHVLGHKNAFKYLVSGKVTYPTPLHMFIILLIFVCLFDGLFHLQICLRFWGFNI